ncbi:MAG: hypothetical protein JST21_02890 [Bacteroidetes bacterium]|nr:hypothetical protein [Bacteroidota bacterium]
MIPRLISAVWILSGQGDTGNNQFYSNDIFDFILFFTILIIYCFLVYQLLFNTNYIISKLKLDKGFEQENFSFNISSNSILNIALIVTACVILFEEIPSFCQGIINIILVKKITPNIQNPGFSNLVFSAVKIILALLLTGERKRIINWIEKRKTAQHNENTE